MASEKVILESVVKRFPESHQLITKLYHTSEFFRSLCDDFADCLQVIDNLASSEKMNRKGYYEEYLNLLSELEAELAGQLSSAPDTRRQKEKS